MAHTQGKKNNKLSLRKQIWTSRKISELEDWLIKMIKPEEWKGKGMKRIEQCVRDRQGTIKTATYVIGILEREKRAKSVFEEIMAIKFPKYERYQYMNDQRWPL